MAHEKLLQQLHERFATVPNVSEVRGVGMLAAVEFMAEPSSKRRVDAALKVGPRISQAARELGMIARAMPDRDILLARQFGFSAALATMLRRHQTRPAPRRRRSRFR